MSDFFPDNWYFRAVIVNWNRVFPSVIIPILIAVSLVVLGITARRKKTYAFLCLYSLGVFVIYFFPLATYVLRPLMRRGSTYWRLFWILPWSILIAAAGVSAVSGMKRRAAQIIAAGLVMAVIAFAGNQVYVGADRAYTRAENPEKVPEDAREAVRLIRESEGVTEKASVRAAFPPDLTPYIRQLDGTITMPFGRVQTDDDLHSEEAAGLFYCYMGFEEYIPLLPDLLKKNACRYAAVKKGAGYDTYLSDGWKFVGETANYSLWKAVSRI